MGKFITIIHRINKALAMASAILVPILTVLIAYDIIRRAFNLHIPKGWSVELGEAFMLLMAYLAVSYILSIGAHVNVDIAINQLPAKPRKAVDIFNLLVFFTYALIMVWRGGAVFLDYTVTGKQTVMGVALYPFAFFIPVAGLLLAAEALIQIYLKLKSGTSSAQP